MVGAPVGRPPVWGGAQGRGGYGVCCGSVGWGVVSVGGGEGGSMGGGWVWGGWDGDEYRDGDGNRDGGGDGVVLG